MNYLHNVINGISAAIRTKCGWLLFIICLFNSYQMHGQTIKPIKYWSFDHKENLLDNISNAKLGVTNNKFKYDSTDSQVGSSIDLLKSSSLTATGGFKNIVKDQFTIEFLFKGNAFFWLTYSQQNCLVWFKYSSITFRTTSVVNNMDVVDNFTIELNGAGRKSYNYYTDDQWHHLVFTANGKTGTKEIWVDGELMDGFSKQIPKAVFKFGDNSGFRDTDQIDELAFYNTIPSAALIKQHYNEMLNGKNYTFQVSNASSNKNVKSNTIIQPEGKGAQSLSAQIDVKEFAPGYPDYDVDLYDQLQNFPDPRINTKVSLERNMSWMDIAYLHRELPQVGGGGFGKTNPQRAIEISAEMAKRWNYYLDIPVLYNTAAGLKNQYSNQNSLYGALINFANKNPQYPVALILYQLQGRPIHAGFDRFTPYITAQDLEAKYYLKDAKGNPIISNKKKYLSPLTSIELAANDGKTAKFYLNELCRYLKIPPALINENGEYFGHFISEALWKKDPVVYADFKRSGLNEAQYSGWFQYRLDSAFKANVMSGLDGRKTRMSFYNLSALNSGFWPDYEQRRKLTLWDAGKYLPTPDFYPRIPSNWRLSMGAFNGYATLAEGRRKEILLGDKFFSPFVSAGWDEEEANVRPAQWLSLLKSMVMFGSDFFYVGYFNITNVAGKWPNGKGPRDPRGYAYQVAMPTYAQAIRTWVPEFFDPKSELLNPRSLDETTNQFRFKGLVENELIMVRKSGNKYLILGSIQPNSNVPGNVPDAKRTEIILEGKKISFEIRRQGSMYVLDLSQKNPVFYQIDGWHQYEHPYYWDKKFVLEGELYSEKNIVSNIIQTNGIKNGVDFVNTTADVVLNKNTIVKYNNIQLTKGKYKLEFLLNKTIRGVEGQFSIQVGDQVSELKYDGKSNIILTNFVLDKSVEDNSIVIKTLKGSILLDKIIIEKVQ